MNSRIRVSADPPDRHLPVSAACVRGKFSSDTLAFLAVQSYQCPSVSIRGSSGFQRFNSFHKFQMPFLGWRRGLDNVSSCDYHTALENIYDKHT
jgi:hypothetical protein